MTSHEITQLWKDALKNIFSIKKRVFELISNDGFDDPDSDAEEGTEEKENFSRFIKTRN